MRSVYKCLELQGYGIYVGVGVDMSDCICSVDRSFGEDEVRGHVGQV